MQIYSQVLGVERVGINDNFFELGGHSLRATVLISKVHKALNKHLPLSELFKYPTVKSLSDFLQKAEEKLYSNIEKVPEKECYLASSAQKRMYILQQFDKYSVAYNIPVIFQLHGEINRERLEKAFKALIERQEILRTYFETNEGEIVQKINKSCEFVLEYKETQESIDSVAGNFVQSFDLGIAPLFRAKLVKSTK